MRARVLVLAVALFASAGAARPAAAQRYRVTPIGPAGVQARALNAAGQVVGWVPRADGTAEAFVTGPDGAALRRLGTLAGGVSSYATGINAAGRVVGYGVTAAGTAEAFVTGPDGGGGLAGLGSLPGRRSSRATGINAAGRVVGDAWDGSASGGGSRTAVTTGADGTGGFVALDIPLLGPEVYGSASAAAAVNGEGRVVGSVYFYGEDVEVGTSFVTGPGAARGLTRYFDAEPYESFVEAVDINDAGQVVGWIAYAAGGSEAFITRPEAPTDPVPLGYWSPREECLLCWAYPHALNNAGRVVGTAEFGEGGYGRLEPFVTGADGAGMRRLGGLLNTRGWVLTDAVDVNDRGQIVAHGRRRRGPEGEAFALLLTPTVVPEPATWALLATGLAGLFGAARRRRA